MNRGTFNVISEGACVADSVQIGSFCVIDDDVIIEAGTVIRSYVEIRKGSRIGRGCYLDSGVKLSGDAVLEDNVTLRYDTIIARGCHIGEGTYVAPQTMFQNLDHNQVAVGGAKVGPHCFIGTNACFEAGIEIAARTIIGSKSLVKKSILESGWIYIGIPARQYKRVSE